MTMLSEVQTVLECFGNVSYYKLNVLKSFILQKGIDHNTLLALKGGTLSNFGIVLSSPPCTTSDANYPTLINIIKRDLSHIEKFKLTWIGRISALKMLLLSKMLYYFGTISIYLHSSCFQKVNGLFKCFIW